ncbi:hypothetical protein AB0I24_07205 [Brachybacterium paraconglomeratum]
MTITAQHIRDHIANNIHSGAAHIRDVRGQLLKMRFEIENITPPPSFTDHALEAARNGTALDPGILDQIAAHHARVEDSNPRLAALAAATNALHTLPAKVAADAADDTLTYLDGALSQYLDHIRGLDLDALPTTAEQALSMNKGRDAWLQVGELLNTYNEIRTQQVKAYAAAGVIDAGAMNARSGQFRNALDTSAEWLDARRETAAKSRARIEQTGRAAAEFFLNIPEKRWSDIEGAYPSNVVSVADRLEFIGWVSERTDAWVPTVKELIDADQENRRRLVLANWNHDGYRGPHVVQ